MSTNKQNELKSHVTWENLTVFFVISKVVQNLNDFWNVFLDKVCIKNEW